MTAENKTGGGGVPGSKKAKIPKRLKGKPKVLLPVGNFKRKPSRVSHISTGWKQNILSEKSSKTGPLVSVSVYCGIGSDKLHAPCRGHDI